MLNRILLVDADIVAFKFAAKGERRYAFGTAVDDLDVVTTLVDDYLDSLMIKLQATDLIICLSCPSAEGWRKSILPSYKENRTDAVKPELLQPLKDYMEKAYPSYRRDGLEADDIMGILSTMQGLPANFLRQYPDFKTEYLTKIIVSEDKDMKTIPGWLFNPAKDSKPRLVSGRDADYWHMYQTLVGDTTDGYKGCPGVGPVRAERLLLWAENDDSTGELIWERVVSLFTEKGLTEEDALVQARVARICRSSDYDFKNKKVIPWSPPQPNPSAATASTVATTDS